MNPSEKPPAKAGIDVVRVMPSLSDSLDATPLEHAQDYIPPEPRKSLWRKVIFTASFMLVVLISLFLLVDAASRGSSEVTAQTGLTNTSANLKAQSTQLTSLGSQLSKPTSSTPSTLTVNGQLAVSNSLVLTPSSTKPASPTAGQIYYNETAKQPQYYNGTQFVDLQSGSSTTNNYTNVTNNYSTTASSGSAPALPSDLLTGSSGANGDLAMFTGSGTLGDSLLNQHGTTVTIGGNTVNVGTVGAAEAVTVGTLNGSGDTTVQGGLGGVTLQTGSVSGTSGSIQITSGASSTTAAGNVSVDSGSSIVNGTVVSDHTFEDGLDGMCGNYGAVPAQSTTEAHSGQYSLSLTDPFAMAQWEVADCEPFSTQVTAGHSYLLSAWVRADSVGELVQANVYFSCDVFQCETGFQNWATATDNTTGWTHFTGLVVAPPGTNYLQLQFFGDTQVADEVHYFDDISVTDLTSSSAMSEVDIGATNAQKVTVGNTAEIGATAIYGGGSGINLNTGVGSISATGAAFTVQSAGGYQPFEVDTNNGGVYIDTNPETQSYPASLSIEGQTSDNASDAITISNRGGANLETIDDAGDVSLGVGAGTSFGYTKIGQHIDGGSGDNTITATKFAAATGGTISSMSGYFGDSYQSAPNNQFGFAIYTDNSGQPGAYLASSTAGTLGSSGVWQTLPITANLQANTTYWLVYWQNGVLTDSSNGINYDLGLNAAQTMFNTYAWQSGADNGWPAMFPSSGIGTVTGMEMSLYATYSSATSALTINSYGSLAQSGAATFQDPTDASDAFQIQSSDGTPLFTADTSVMTITIGGSLSILGHLITGGSPPSIAAGAAACTSPTVNISGTDTAGTITITTGSGCSLGGSLGTITFANAFTATPRISLTPGSAAAAGLNTYFDNSTLTDDGFSIATSSTPADSTSYVWDYQVLQ